VSLQVTGRGGVPTSGVAAVVFNLTAAEAEARGYVTAWPTGLPRPLASTVNVDLGTTIAVEDQALPNLVTVPVGHDGTVSLYASMGTHLIADIAGYYQAAVSSAEGRFQPVGPTRILDTRPTSGPVGYSGAKPAAGDTVTVMVAGHGGVPDTGVSAVVLTVTGTEATERGFVTAYPSGVELPLASNLNLERTDATIANQVIVPLGADVSEVAGDVGDEVGAALGVEAHRTIQPTRYLDTRTGPQPAAGAEIVAPPPDSTIPDVVAAGNTLAAVANLTATQADGPGYVTVAPASKSTPLTSTLNLERAGQTLSDHVTVGVAGEQAEIFTQSSSHFVADVVGWYMP
jgi:hypothetical protein